MNRPSVSFYWAVGLGLLATSCSNKSAAPYGRDALPTAALAATGQFYAANGRIIDPSGNVFMARGINVGDPSIASQVLQLFPGTNFIRFADGDHQPASFYQPFIDVMSANHVVVEIEDHPWPLANAYSGAQLTDETNWYASLAATYKNNPYVWFGSMNEPQGGDITGQQVATYQAIRNQNANNMILFEAGVGAGNPGQTGPAALDASSYSGMHNIVWDMHFYGWVNGEVPDQSSLDGKLLGAAGTGTGIRSLQEIASGDGAIPIINAEFGNSTDGNSIDANGDQVIYAVTNWAIANGYTSGFAAWHWHAADTEGDLLQKNGVRTHYGDQIAQAIAALAGSPPPPPPTGGSCQIVLTTTSGGSITDGAGNVWTLDASGSVVENGSAVAGGGGTAQLTYVAATGTIWGQDGSSGNWYSWNGNWNGPTATSPIQSCQVVLTPASGGSVTDSAGNVWTLDASGNVDKNGSPVAGGGGTAKLTYVASTGTIWGQDAGSGGWYAWNGNGWTGPSPTSPI
jgi:mannan endo-1,4-beta-mannosidase